MKKRIALALITALLLLGSLTLADYLDPWDAVPDLPRVCCFRLNGTPLSNYVSMQKSSSSIFSELGYVEEYHHLYVRFSLKTGSGSVYLYTNVPPDIYRQLLAAPSTGTFFNETVKGNFPCFRVYE